MARRAVPTVEEVPGMITLGSFNLWGFSSFRTNRIGDMILAYTGRSAAPIRIGVDLVACEFQPLGFEATIGRLGEPSLPWKRSQG
jgi:hypothetical protein